MLGDPPSQQVKGPGLEPAGAHAPDLVRADQARALERADLPGDPSKRQWQRVGDDCHRSVSFAQQLDDEATRRVGQRAEYMVQFEIVAHARKCWRDDIRTTRGEKRLICRRFSTEPHCNAASSTVACRRNYLQKEVPYARSQPASALPEPRSRALAAQPGASRAAGPRRSRRRRAPWRE